MLNENLHQVKKIVLSAFRKDGLFKVRLAGKDFKLLYEGSRQKGDRDYEVMRFLGRNKRCVLDIGGNIGLATLMMAQDNHAAVHTFEASEYAAKLIIHHANANGIGDRVTVVNTLVTDESGSAVPFYWDFNSGGASIFKGRLGHNFPIIKTSIAIDDYVSRQQISPDLMKIDVEGAEFLVLKGSLKTLEKMKPLAFVELHANGELPLWKNAEHILRLIEPVDYTMIYLRTKQVVTDPEVLKDRGRCHVLLCHKQHPVEHELKDLDTSFL